MVENQQRGNKKPRTDAPVSPEISSPEQRGRNKGSQKETPEIAQSSPCRIPKQRGRIPAPPVRKLILVVRANLRKIEAGNDDGWLPPVGLWSSVLLPVQLVWRLKSVAGDARVIEGQGSRAHGEYNAEPGRGSSQPFRASDCKPDHRESPQNGFERPAGEQDEKTGCAERAR